MTIPKKKKVKEMSALSQTTCNRQTKVDKGKNQMKT